MRPSDDDEIEATISGTVRRTALEISMTDLDLTRYPILLRHVKAQWAFRLRDAMSMLAAGQAVGRIRNVEYQNARAVVSRVVEDAWREVRGPHFYNGQYAHLPQAVQDLDATVNVYGLHDVLAAYKRLTRSTLDHVAIREMRAFVVEVHPLAMAVAALKATIVKGRAPSTGPSKPVNPNKIVKTCPCCFREIAVTPRGTMAHHGYQRPGHGWQTSSCPGIRFKPLEVSQEGLVWLIGSYRNRLAACKNDLAGRDRLTKLTIRRGFGFAEITTDMPEWDQQLRTWCVQIEGEIRALTQSLAYCEARLASWKPGAQVK